MSLGRDIRRVIGLAIIVSMCVAVGFAQTSVVVSPAAKNVLPGRAFTLSVIVNNVVRLHAARTVVTFNNAIIQSTSIANGTFMTGSVFYQATPTTPTSSTNSILFEQAILGPGGVSGSGVLFTITFAAAGNGTSSVTLSSLDLRDTLDAQISTTTQSGSVTVTNPAQTYVNSIYTPGNAGGHDFGFDAFATVQGGVDAVNAGGTVTVASGTYAETVSLNKSLIFSGSSPIIQNLQTTNNANVILGGPLQVSGILTLTSGSIATGLHKISVTNNAVGAVVVTSGSVSGELERAIAEGSAGTYVFTNTNTFLQPDGNQEAMTASVKSFPNTSPPNIGNGRAINRYYIVTPSGPLNATLRLSYLDGEINGINEDDMTLFRYNGAAWTDEGGAANPSGNFVELADVSTFSMWTIGDAQNPLPIQLASFTGSVLAGGNVSLIWVTLSEVNNYGFYVQRKRLTEPTYLEIPNSFIAGHGTTNEPHTYTFLDGAPGIGTWQYRLKQVDLNGSVLYTDPVQVDVLTGVTEEDQPYAYSLKQNYPNPFNPTTTIQFTIPAGTYGHTSLRVFDVLGREVATLVNEVMAAGRHTAKLDGSGLASGLYFYCLQAGEFVAVKRMTLLR